MRVALYCSSDPLRSYREYSTLWSIAARNGWSMVAVLADDSLEELRRLIVKRAVDAVLVWSAESLGPLQDELRRAQCRLYAHQQVAPLAPLPDVAGRETVRELPARAEGKRVVRPRVGEIEQAIRAALATKEHPQGDGLRRRHQRRAADQG